MIDLNGLINILKLNNKGIIVLTVAIVLDMVSGCLNASLKEDLKSKVFKQGLQKKILDYVLVVVAFMLDWLMSLNYVGVGTLYCLIAMEFYSVLENVQDYIPLPTVIKKVLGELSDADSE